MNRRHTANPPLLPNKAHNFQFLESCARAVGFQCPTSVYLSSINWGREKDTLENILKSKFKGVTRFAIRGCILNEDGERTNAGQSLTELDVQKENVKETIASLLMDGRHIGVLLQEFITSDFSGVYFSQHPEAQHIAYIEYNKDFARVVNDPEKAMHASLGRFSGRIIDSIGSLNKIDLNRIFLCCLQLELLTNQSIDVEWALSKNRLYVFQLRKIRAPERTSLTQELSEAKKHGCRSFQFVDISSTVEISSRLTLSVLCHAYNQSLPIAKKNLKLPDFSERFHCFQDQLYLEKPDFSSLRSILSSFSAMLFKKKSLTPAALILIAERIRALQSNRSMLEERSISQLTIDLFQIYFPLVFSLGFFLNKKSGTSAVTSPFYLALSKLQFDRDYLEKFLTTWGHRATNDYELSCPRFSENPNSALAYAQRFAGFSGAKKEYIDSIDPDILRDLVRDEAVYLFSILRKKILALSKKLSLAENCLFALSIEDLVLIEELGAKNPSAARDRISALIKPIVPSNGLLPEVEYTLSQLELSAARSLAKSFRRGVSGIALHATNAEFNLAENSKAIFVIDSTQLKYTSLMPYAQGFVVESLNHLSHFSILCREQNIPIVELKNARFLIENGSRIAINECGEVYATSG